MPDLDAGNFGLPRGTDRPRRLPLPPQVLPAAAPDANLGAALGLGGVPGGVSLPDGGDVRKVSAERLDDMIRRRLIDVVCGTGRRRRAQPPSRTPRPDGVRDIALRVAEQGAVLLRNVGHILPLHAP